VAESSDAPAPATSPAAGSRGPLFRAAGVYWLGHLAGASVAVLLLPIVTRYLRPEALGLVTMFGLFTTFCDAVVGLGVASAPGRRAFDLERAELARYVGTTLAIIGATSIAIALLCAALAGPLEEATLLPLRWVLVGVAVSAANAVASATLALLQALGRPWSYTAIQVGRTLVGFGLSLWLVAGAELGWSGRAAGIAGGALLAAPVSLVALRAAGLLRLAWDREHARHALAYGLPLVPHTLGAVVMALADRYLVAQTIDLASAGVYSVGYQLGFAIALLQDGFNKAWAPWLFARLKTADDAMKARLVRLTYLYDVTILAIAALVALAAPPVLSVLVPERYQGAREVVLWIALAWAFNGMYKMVANYIFWAERTRLLAWVTFSAAALYVPLAWSMIRWNGAIGAAQASTVIFAAMWLATWALSARCHPMPWLRPRG
jgi:O-antigen/teichoic acid export membrane protein